MVRPLPMAAFGMYLMEKHNREIYKEDCLYLMSAANMEEENRHMLKQPYLRRFERKQNQSNFQQSKANETPYRTKEEMVDFIFEGL